MPNPARHLPVFLISVLYGCVALPNPERGTAQRVIASDAPSAAFLSRLRSLCGKAFAGRIVADTPVTADSPFSGKPLVMHVRDCREDAVRIPFHVGDDHSRTWVITLDSDRHLLRLKHDHRHADGSEDATTQYGGDSRALTEKTPDRWRFEFPADTYTKTLFHERNLTASLHNVWAIELDADRFVYELARPNRLFRVEFDLTQPQPLPPEPWGAGASGL